ncbi:MAG TPA: hypothetical protein PLB91_14425 [Spirochaetales bacterium]|nr:hypothetical protein [Spirochaetales bacterium]HRY55322.1 hypothetical protein [Spirochaetia bacterium]HRZ64324.1 hypothetical protein [Spirochaetia bacterium]
MQLDINPRGNGACPLCAAQGACRLQERLAASLSEAPDAENGGMEIVVYSCPSFREKA